MKNIFRRTLSAVLSVLMFVSIFTGMSLVSSAADDVLQYITYEIKNKEVIITGFDKNVYGQITLPEKIKGYPVTEIGENAFLQSGISHVEFPKTLKKIGYGAFWNSLLEIVSIPDSVTSIGDDAFGDCFSLKAIYTGKNITSIPSQMLRECGSLTDVFINKKVKEIGFWGFNLSENIENIYFEGTEAEWKKITVAEGNDVLKTANIVFNCTDSSYAVCQPTQYNETLHMGYSIALGEVTIEYTDSNITGDCVIPEKINGCPVTTIFDAAFNFEPDMSSVTIPAYVDKIINTFGSQCFNVKNIYVDERNQHYSSQDGNLFNKDKTKLLRYAIGNDRQHYTIPDTVTTIKEFAFCRMYTTLNLTIPASVTTIEEFAFYNSHHLYNINVDKDNPNYMSEDGVLFNKDQTKLICFPALKVGAYHWGGYENDGVDTTKDSYTIPYGVKEIGNGAFSSCEELAKIEMPDSVEIIGENAFERCYNLENVVLPESIRDIKRYAFFESGLKSIHISDSVESIGNQAFEGSKNLSEINIGNNIKSIGWGAFSRTEYYENADNWEDNALYIGNCLIEVEDEKITEYTVKAGTRTIGWGAFSWCYNLKKINLPASLNAVGDYAFAFNSTLEKVVIPEGVTEIGYAAFGYCDSLREVSIPESVKTIAEGAFYACDRLEKINFAGSENKWNKIDIENKNNENLLRATITYGKDSADDLPEEEPPAENPPVEEPPTEDNIPDDVLMGDLDIDGKVTAIDARTALRISAQIEKGTAYQITVADMNADGRITAIDARKILRIAAQLD